jgi:ubiquinone/menaquinone biosynthesis C-methylase UbiE
MLIEAIATLLLVDTFKLWRRRSSYPAIQFKANQNQPNQTVGHLSRYQDFMLFTAPGLTIDEQLLKLAVQWAEDEGLLVVDLCPSYAQSVDQLSLLQKAHPINYSQKPFAQGITAGLAIVIHESVYQRFTFPTQWKDWIEWVDFAHSLKRYAPWQSSLLLVKNWKQVSFFEYLDQNIQGSTEEHAKLKRTLLSMMHQGQMDLAKVALPLIWFALIRSMLALEPMGFVCTFIWTFQPMLILGDGFARDSKTYSLLRPWIDFKNWLFILGPSLDQKAKEKEDKKREYQELLKDGTDRFFEPREERCPICQLNQLKLHLELSDQYQSKPGTFRLDQCERCGHIFQNPRLSIEGLNFYYKDFYDGLGEEGMDKIFGASDESYKQRIAMIRSFSNPQNWLDVGGGHGHFALIAKHMMPQTQFDVLDLSESVDIAAKRGWIHQGMRGLFPEMAESLKGKYDGISMSHYLEHTIKPIDEIKAASVVLETGGVLMIEVPNPESKIAKVLGSFWLPWFQPQHLNLLSIKNLQRLLEAHQFEVLSVDCSNAHQSVDLFFSVLILLQRLAPDPNRPWQYPEPSNQRKSLLSLWRLIVVLVCLPLVLIAYGLDLALRPLLAKEGYSNTYRMIAQKK